MLPVLDEYLGRVRVVVDHFPGFRVYARYSSAISLLDDSNDCEVFSG
jgi:hypothetical protein